jgi:3-oxoadipate enol-lactonase
VNATSETLVLLAPIGLGAGAWDRVELPDLVAMCHEVPGFGRRPRAPEQPTMASLADEVAASYEGPLVLVGVSMGSMVAQNVAVRHPGRVRSLVLACTGAAVDGEAMRRRAGEVEAEGMAGVLDETLERWFTPGALAARPEHPGVAYARRTLLALDPACFADGWRAIATHDVRARLGEISAPATCVAGRSDPVGTLERVAEIAEGVRDSRLVAIEGPHMILLEEPAAFSEAILDHLAWSRERVAA